MIFSKTQYIPILLSYYCLSSIAIEIIDLEVPLEGDVAQKSTTPSSNPASKGNEKVSNNDDKLSILEFATNFVQHKLSKK